MYESKYSPSNNGLIVGQTGFSNVLWQPVYEKENPKFQHGKFHLKIDLVWHPAYLKGWINTYIHIHQTI